MRIRGPWHAFLTLVAPVAAALAGISVPSANAAEAPVAETCQSSPGKVALKLTIEGVRSAKGTISVAIYGDRPEDFLAKGKKVAKTRLPAQIGAVQGCITLPRPGTYAITAYHDEDDDRHLTRNLLGLPTEGFALSNIEATPLSFPSFKEVAVTVNENNSQETLKMTYP